MSHRLASAVFPLVPAEIQPRATASIGPPVCDVLVCRDVSMLVERTGGDAAKLDAPLQVHGSEVQLQEALSAQPLQQQLGGSLHFLCDTLMVHGAAPTSKAQHA